MGEPAEAIVPPASGPAGSVNRGLLAVGPKEGNPTQRLHSLCAGRCWKNALLKAAAVSQKKYSHSLRRCFKGDGGQESPFEYGVLWQRDA